MTWGVGLGLYPLLTTFSAADPSNNAVSSNFKLSGKSSYVDSSQYPDDPDMPALEDITYSNDEEDEEGIDYEKVFAPVARIEAIRLFLAYVSFMEFMVYQMDVKSAFLCITIEEEVYVCQHPSFEDLDYPDKVYKVVKALYGLHQAPRAWKFGLTDGKLASTPIDTEKPLLKDPDGEDVDVHTYRSMIGSLIEYAGASLDKKSTTGGCQFRGCRLISWQCKKQTVVATSLTEAEYVAAASCCAQVLWIQNQLLDYRQTATGKENSNLTMADSMPKAILQFWSSVSLKKTVDVMRLQALIDRRKVIITEDMVRQALRLDDADSIDCLPNEEIFAELARMGYEKYKVDLLQGVFLAQWKFLIHTILQCMSAKRTAWNKFSSSMASAVICLSTEDEDAAEPTPPSPTPATTPLPPPQQELISSPPQEIGKEEKVESFRIQEIEEGEEITELDADEDVTLEEVAAEVTKDAEFQGMLEESQAQVYHLDLEHAQKVLITTATTITAAPVPKASALRKRRGVIIQDSEETVTTSLNVQSEVKSKDKGKGILVEWPKSLKRQAQIEQDEAFARELEAELNANINWNEVIEQVKIKEKQDNTVMRYQSLKRKSVTEAQARKNMIVYLKNMAGFKMDFFKGMSYTDIRPIFEKHFNSNWAFLKKRETEIEEEESKLSKRKSKNLEQQASKKEDLEMLWKITQERFASSEPKNFSDDFLLNTLKTMFEKPNVEANIWKNQRVRYGLAKVKIWKLLESRGVHIITFTTTQMIVLVERRYPLTRFTLDQMLNNVSLEVEEESKVSLELLRFVRRQQQEGYKSE
nr:ribonuclease H-like domain, reverse transcriptase, RNA-dependent DNA polymerase [Tanacetum cinerariifolium]